MPIVWVLEPQDAHRWEMGPQCVTRVGVVASYGVGGILWGLWSSCCRMEAMGGMFGVRTGENGSYFGF